MPTKDEAAKDLANKHYQVEAGIERIFRIMGSADVELQPNEPIKLLEVNESTVPSGIMPIRFGPAPESGIHFPSVIVEVTPEEFEKIQTKELALPNDWRVDGLIPKEGQLSK